jgi:hypothetical protein
MTGQLKSVPDTHFEKPNILPSTVNNRASISWKTYCMPSWIRLRAKLALLGDCDYFKTLRDAASHKFDL